MGFWDFFWLLIWSYFLFAYLMLLFHVLRICSETGSLADSPRGCGRSG